MPFIREKSQKDISKDIATEMKFGGQSRKQTATIGVNVADKSKKIKKKGIK